MQVQNLPAGGQFEEIVFSWTLVKYIPRLQVPFTQWYSLSRAQIWHPAKKFSLPVPLRILTYRGHDVNPNREGIYVARAVVRRTTSPGKAGIDRVFEIQLLKPKEIKHEPKRKLVVVSTYEKAVGSGAYRKSSVECGEEFILFAARNVSGTGRHWVTWRVFLAPIEKPIKIYYVWHGAKRLVEKYVIEV